MRGKRAKQIRRIVYGTENSPRFRKYFLKKQKHTGIGLVISTNQIIADKARGAYQKAKKEWTTKQ